MLKPGEVCEMPKRVEIDLSCRIEVAEEPEGWNEVFHEFTEHEGNYG
jgi:hypothetical protein